jgi:Uma2 family endonuclease
VAVEIDPPDLYRLSLEEYHRLIESGGFDEDARIELIDGLLVAMSPRTASHDNIIEWLACELQLAVDPKRMRVRSCLALTIGASEPEPDIAIVEVHTPRPYHPATAALVVEVSVSSLGRDLRHKPTVYARAGIPLYWVIDVDHRRAVVHTQPGAEGYAGVEVVGPEGELTAEHIGVPPISLGEVLAAGES